jgi:biopolymer transport protein ExbB/TolQ
LFGERRGVLSGEPFSATGVVQFVMLLLMAGSVCCWALIVEKAVVLFRLRRQAATLARLGELSVSQPTSGVAFTLIQVGLAEANTMVAEETTSERRQRVERAMRDVIVDEILKGQARLGNLATIGSVAPFVGLFGTVWGIMHSFLSIAQANDTSLAVVAPGIAEALSTTAIGLVAAIPASVGYNKLVADFNVVAHRLMRAADGMARNFAIGSDIPGANASRRGGR